MTNHNAPATENQSLWQQAKEWTGNFVRNNRVRTIGTVAALATAVPLFAGCATNAEPKTTDEAPSPHQTTSEVTNQNEITKDNIDQVIDQLDIPTAEEVEIPAGLSDYELGKTVNTRLDDWNNAGTKPSDVLVDIMKRSSIDLPIEDVNARITSKTEEAYGAGLFGDDYKDDPTTHDLADRLTDLNLTVLKLNEATLFDQYNNKEPFRQWSDFIDSRPYDGSSNGSTRAVDVTIIDRNNTDKNTVTVKTDDSERHMIYFFKEVDGKMEITDIQVP